jgi:DNA-binding CsgD family transcriptional regulator
MDAAHAKVSVDGQPGATRTRRTVGRPAQWVGRTAELALLGDAIEALRSGEGSVVWVEGEPGIGKSSLVAEALTTDDPEWELGWGMADKLTERLPLHAMLDCLEVRLGSPDPRRAAAAELLRGRWLDPFAEGDMSTAGVEVLMTLVDELCAAAPTVLVLDDLQWADDASLIIWHQLAANIDRLRLLLIGTCRPTPQRRDLQQVRAAVRRGGTVITMGPLPETDVATMVGAMVGAPPGHTLRRLTAQAAGNPLYVRELVDALTREQSLRISTTAEVTQTREQLPLSLAAVLSDRLSSVPAATANTLRTAALLGGRFAVTDLAVVLRRPVSDLAPSLQEAVAAGILAGSGAELAFRHQLIQQALYESMPEALRTALHTEAARELAAAGADALSVAQQLSAAGRVGESWARDWLVESAATLATRAPALAAKLLRRELEDAQVDEQARDGLMVGLEQALLAAGSYDEAAELATQALTAMSDQAPRGQMSWMMARAQVSTGDNRDAITTIGQALESVGLPAMWRARMLALLSMLQRSGNGDLDGAESTARQALIAGEEAADPFATTHALADLWLTHSVRRDYAAAYGYLDQALQALDDDPGCADLRSYVLVVRVFALQNLDRWQDAELALRQAREYTQRSGVPDGATWANAAVLRYWLGQWDDALAELSFDDISGDAYLRERWPVLLSHGVGALIAGRRDERTTAARQLRKGLALPIQSITDRENQDFLVAAHAVALEQSGETRQAMVRLSTIMPRRDGEMTLLHQWLPDLVRLALTVGDQRMAQAAAQACQDEAAAETTPARAAAASLRCRGLLESDPDPLRQAVAHYRAIGPAAELPAALEDLAVVLAGHSRDDEARATLNEAIDLYDSLQARWDIRRATNRLRPYGVRRGTRGPRRQRAASGWDALTETEVKIAALIARGDSTSDIATGMFLSRRTVQTYISRILAKLGAKGRVEIVREALSHGASA